MFFTEDALKFLILYFKQQRNVEKLKLIADAKLKYITEWGEARCEQNSLRCDMEIEKLEKILNNWRIREKNKQRVHAELTKFMTQDIGVSIVLFMLFNVLLHYSINVLFNYASRSSISNNFPFIWTFVFSKNVTCRSYKKRKR